MEIINAIKARLDSQPDLKYELVWQSWSTDFLRFYHNQTNYNITKDKLSLGANLYKGKKSYAFAVDQPDEAKCALAIDNALALIDRLPEDPDFVDMETDLRIAPARQIPDNIEGISLQTKTDILARIAERLKHTGFEIYGTFVCNKSHFRLINSNGLDKTTAVSPIYLEVKAVHQTSQVTVLETFGGEDFKLFDEAAFIDALLLKVESATGDILDVEPGYYDVVLAPRCLAEFVQYLAFGMDARSVDQHSSFFEDKVGQKLFPEIISITDDPFDPSMIRRDYGSNGHIYNKLDLIDRGVFKAFSCDNYYAYKTGIPKNGNTMSCLKIAPGDKTLLELIASVKNGLYISSLHYMNFINPRETSLTGLTRDGTFLIRDGKLAGVVNNLRFTERIDRILNNVLALENKAVTIPFSGNYEDFDIEAMKAPHALVKDFNITSSTHTI
jgi:predicted Zn-dependent protease